MLPSNTERETSTSNIELAEHTERNRIAIEHFCSGNAIDVDLIKKMRPEERNTHLITHLFGADDGRVYDASTPRCDHILSDDDFGVLVVKPEMLPCVSSILNFMSSNRLEPQALRQIYPTKQEWLGTYGYMLKDYPNTVNTYVTQVNFGVMPIVFRHLPAVEYKNIAIERKIEIDSKDRDTMFDQIFCGKVAPNHAGTLRGGVVLPNLLNLGFADMTGYAEPFDPFDYYKDSDAANTFISFSGVHIPSNRREKYRTMVNYIKQA
ncbi:MAG: hypothetical protein LBL84_00180 [Candidatus Nomurabacteria bacterium]|jgi:hypothetical protein|nr:hypothetical protein [Candidatus Nomurabacteria bacterium]